MLFDALGVAPLFSGLRVRCVACIHTAEEKTA